jgi:hypothetical protein
VEAAVSRAERSKPPGSLSDISFNLAGVLRNSYRSAAREALPSSSLLLVA